MLKKSIPPMRSQFNNSILQMKTCCICDLRGYESFELGAVLKSIAAIQQRIWVPFKVNLKHSTLSHRLICCFPLVRSFIQLRPRLGVLPKIIKQRSWVPSHPLIQVCRCSLYQLCLICRLHKPLQWAFHKNEGRIMLGIQQSYRRCRKNMLVKSWQKWLR